MPTTSNFGWNTPADTDLVKDGAAAIRTLGNNIDASFVDLKGGTTGQVLAKATNTDLDFTWVAQDDSNAIQNAIVDAKGDLITATANDTPARLAVGTNGQYLQADSTTSTGLKWATVSAGSLTLLSTTTLTGQNVSITGISQSYTDLIISIYQVNPSNTANLFVELRNGANAQTISVAGYNGSQFNTFNQTSSIQVGSSAFLTGETANNNYIYVQDYKSTTEYKRNLNSRGLFTTSGFALTGYNYDGYINGTSAINAVFVDLAGTNTFSSGTVQIWGVN